MWQIWGIELYKIVTISVIAWIAGLLLGVTLRWFLSKSASRDECHTCFFLHAFRGSSQESSRGLVSLN